MTVKPTGVNEAGRELYQHPVPRIGGLYGPAVTGAPGEVAGGKTFWCKIGMHVYTTVFCVARTDASEGGSFEVCDTCNRRVS